MALFNKIFSSHKRKSPSTPGRQPNSGQFPFTHEQVRILLYQETESNGRKLLFDSNAIQKVNLSTSDALADKSYIEISDGIGYKYVKPENDHNTIGEMVFGSVAMAYRGTALKVHWMHSPTRILCSKVFLSPIYPNQFLANSSNDTNHNEVNSNDTSSVNSFSLSACVSDQLNALGCDKYHTNPLDVPHSETSESGPSFAYSDSGYGGDPWNVSCSSYCPYSSTRSSLTSMYSDRGENSRKFSVDSSLVDSSTGRNSGNLQRRILRNLSTSFENRKSVSDCIGFIGDSANQHTTNGGSEGYIVKARRSSEQVESRSNPEMMRKKGTSGDMFRNHHSSTRSTIRRAKIGLAVCITMTESVEKEMQLFCCEHIALLESMMCRLRAAAENAWINSKRNGQVMLLHAWFSATEWITDLFTAPRLSEPIWLALSCGYSNDPSALAISFMNELCSLLNSADTKDTNFFISKLLTAILTYHLGWVCTVAPITHYSNTSKTVAEAVAREEKDKMSEISKYHPYNALWAQMGDLYGAIGSPPRISKTIVCGNETKFLEKVLNVLTYFIRCSEIRRDIKTEVYDKNVVNNSVSEVVDPKPKVDDFLNSVTQGESTILKKVTGLTRAPTCIKDLTALSDNSVSDSCANQAINSSLTSAFKKNDIPNVLIFRDSRVVRQELRIGNFLMDTGIEMSTKQKLDLQNYKGSGQQGEHIKLLVTSPDNEEINVGSLDEYSTESEDTVEEATECLVTSDIPKESKNGPTLSDMITANSIGQGRNRRNPSTFLWGIEPVKEGLSVEQWQNIEKGIEMRNGNCLSDGKLDIFSVYNKDQDVPELKRSKSLYTKSTNAKNSDHMRKHKLIRKASFSIADCQNDENSDPVELKTHPSLSDLITANSVGVSERLTWGIEPYKEAVSLEEEQHFEIAKKRIETTRSQSGVLFVLGDNDALIGLKNNGNEIKKSEMETKIERSLNAKKTCSHKKHSGVKFNFEQYPQIATNYMKNKNIDIANYGFIEKGLKLEESSNLIYGPSTSNFPSSTSEEENTECEYCAGNASRILQTPSNATELEFSVDDLPFIDSKKVSDASSSSMSLLNQPKEIKSKSKLVEDKLLPSKQIQFIKLPMPKYIINDEKNVQLKTSQHRPGFIPSLFVGVTDHYISDMVLQGTVAPPTKWEAKLKNHLTLASRCAMIEQQPTENVAIIANIDKWDVKLVSSQTSVLPNTNGSCVGMSQLVSTMLETVHVMWTSGINAYQCMSYIESKLQELYLQSETLAAFLLATNFCNLETITSALNLSEYDVPLLMSVASCHSPQLTKKYDVSYSR